MKILYLCSKEYWNHKMSRVRFHAVDAIGRHPDIDLIKSGPGWEGFTDCKSEQDKHNPDLILWYKPLNIPGYESVTVPTCLRYNEMWDITWTTEEIVKSKSKIIICHHNNDIKNFNHIKSAKLFHNPHCAEKTIFKEYSSTKDIDIQIIGVISPEFYPLRSRFKNIIETKMVPVSNPVYRLLPHPGYHIEDVNAQVMNYARQLSRAKINITCSSRYKYALAKYPEAPLCKSLLIADKPDENNSWYDKWLVSISPSDSDDKIIEVINTYLKNDSLREEKIKIGYEENLRLRTQENYAENFVNIIKKFIP